MFKAERTFSMESFGWKDCTFTFKALTFGEQQELDVLRQQWSTKIDEKEIQEAALKILDIMKKQFIRGQALNEEGNKVDVKPEDFEDQVPFDVFLKLTELVTSGQVDESFLVK